MTEAEARGACARLAREHPDRETHQWHPRREDDGSWSVVKIALPPGERSPVTETRAEERPPTDDDPRTAAMRNLGPNIGPVL
jgi:hypothetical protein